MSMTSCIVRSNWVCRQPSTARRPRSFTASTNDRADFSRPWRWMTRLKAEVLVAPFQFRCTPQQAAARVPALGEMTEEPAQ